MAVSSDFLTSVYEEIRPRVLNNTNPNVQQLIEKNFDLRIEDLENLIIPNNDLDAIIYYGSLIVLRLKEEAPIGEKALAYNQWFTYLYSLNKGWKESLYSTYVSSVIREVLECKNIDILVAWMDILQNFKNCNLDTSQISASIYINFMGIMWENIMDTVSPSDPNKIIKFLVLLKKAQDIQLEVDDFLSIAVNNVCNYIETETDIDGIQAELGQRPNKDIQSARVILGYISELIIREQELNERIKKIISVIGEPLVVAAQKNVKNPKPPARNIIIPENPYKIDFSQLEFIENLYARQTTELGVVVYKAKHPTEGLLAVKEYTAKVNIRDLDKFSNEISILNKLSSFAGPESCFLKYYGHSKYENKLFLVMEFANNNMMTIISHYKKLNYTFTDDQLFIIIKKLISSYAFMEELKIYHQDIKPHNLIVDDDFGIKIIDFGIAELKEENNFTMMITGANPIQGTSGYMAPELQEYLDKGEKTGKFKPSKADVFSLGMTILQIVLLEDLFSLNKVANHQRLLDKINTVKIEWIKSLLYKMLFLDYKKRPKFTSLLGDIPGGGTTFAS